MKTTKRYVDALFANDGSTFLDLLYQAKACLAERLRVPNGIRLYRLGQEEGRVVFVTRYLNTGLDIASAPHID